MPKKILEKISNKIPEAIEERRIATIDIGSNSVRFVIYELYGAAFTPIYNEKILAGLGRDLQLTGNLHVQGAEQAFAALKRFKILAEAQNLDEILIAATAALRDANDAHGFITRVRDEIGFDITPLSGEREAFMSAMGVISGDVRAEGIAADLGGASLELIEMKAAKAFGGITYPLGPFSMFKDNFDPAHLRKTIIEHLSQGPEHKTGQDLFLIGGAWRNLSLIHQKRIGYPLRVAYNYRLDIPGTKAMAEWAYSPAGIEEIMQWRGLSSRRADTLPYSGLLLNVLLDVLKPKSVLIAPGGLREGLVYNAFSDDFKNRPALFDACRALARGRQQGAGIGRPLYEFLQPLDTVFPRSFNIDNENRLRQAACLLVGIGKGLHPDHKARMVFRTVLYAPFPNLTHTERAYLALMLFSAYTSKKTTPNDAALDYLLSPEMQSAACIYGEAMRMGVSISGRNRTILSQCALSANPDALSLHLSFGDAGLVTERGQLRLERLASLLGLSVQA
ncbi:MAG: exopolyphosphatase [Robiginitomaculum sp.]|nr:MAG: exopolyphosphatase [Robiginitomaculum sp.]